MCQGVPVAELISVIPENLRPSNEEITRIIAEYSQREEPIEVVLEEDANFSLCCQHFIDFVENHLMPYFIGRLQNIRETMSEIEYNSNLKEQQGHWVNFLDALNTTNCHTYFSDWPPNLEYRKKIQEGDSKTLLQAKKHRSIHNIIWPIYEFEKCLNGEDFDFDNYVKSPFD